MEEQEKMEEQKKVEEPEKMEEQVKNIFSSIPDIAIKVITKPVEFYKEMPRLGGYIDPLVFMVAMGVVSGIVQAIFGILGLGFTGSFVMALASVIYIPILVAIFGFVGAAIIFIIWKIMGSQESFETSYRCIAYAAAISPITAVLNIIPYAGSVLGLAWMTYLIVVASIEVHSIKPKIAWIVFGAICVIFSLLSITSQYAARKFTGKMESFQQEMDKSLEKIEEMSPEEAGKAVGEFLKGLQEGVKK